MVKKKQTFKRNFKKSLSIIAFSIGSILSTNAQLPSTWNGGNSTTTSGALGIGTINPQGWQEIIYCNKQQNGLIITNNLCPSDPLFNFPISFDGVAEPAPGSEPGGGGTVIPYPTMDFTLRQYGTFLSSKPMLWLRMQNHSSLVSSASGPYSSRFIVTTEGTSGINIEVPRATFDVKSLGSYNYPGLIVGRQPFNSPSTTQHTMFIPLLSDGGYNSISQDDDQGMFFTDGNGTNGSNQNGSFVIAPWTDPSSAVAGNIGGLRMDYLGNIEVRGKIKSTGINVEAKWWADSVFSDTAQLMSFIDLENFIKRNKRLPEMPSEDEIFNNGIDVSDMMALQTKKIEELTLYIIELRKLIEAQEKKIGDLVNENK